MNEEYMVAAAKLSPGATATGMSFAGVPLNEWVLLATLAFTVFQLGFLLWDRFVKNKDKKDD